MPKQHSIPAPIQNTGVSAEDIAALVHPTCTPAPIDNTSTKDDLVKEAVALYLELDPTNRLIMLTLLKGLRDRDGGQIKLALDWGIEHRGSDPYLIDAYTTFGVVPYVLEATV